jgi:hypothetical protein
MNKLPLIAFVLLAALVAPCASASSPTPAPAPATKSAPPPILTPAPDQLPLKNFYPAKGQTPEQQVTDTQECNKSAVASSGYNPGVYQAAGEPQQAGVSKFQKAMRACMTEHGYTVQ